MFELRTQHAAAKAGLERAHVAAPASEHGARLCTTDRDFVLFEPHGLGLVHWREPAAS